VKIKPQWAVTPGKQTNKQEQEPGEEQILQLVLVNSVQTKDTTRRWGARL
jgi:hypothetical protein